MQLFYNSYNSTLAQMKYECCVYIVLHDFKYMELQFGALANRDYERNKQLPE